MRILITVFGQTIYILVILVNEDIKGLSITTKRRKIWRTVGFTYPSNLVAYQHWPYYELKMFAPYSDTSLPTFEKDPEK